MIENKVYAAIILRLEELEHKGTYNGNAHHLAQDLAKMVAVNLLSRPQKRIYECLNKERDSAIGASDISYHTDISTKNVASQIQQIQKKTNLIGIIKEGKNNRYYQL